MATYPGRCCEAAGCLPHSPARRCTWIFPQEGRRQLSVVSGTEDKVIEGVRNPDWPPRASEDSIGIVFVKRFQRVGVCFGQRVARFHHVSNLGPIHVGPTAAAHLIDMWAIASERRIQINQCGMWYVHADAYSQARGGQSSWAGFLTGSN